MNIDLVSQIPFDNPQALRDFNLVHALVHDETAAALAQTYGVPQSSAGVSGEAALEDWVRLMSEKKKQPPPMALRNWLDLHAQIHSNTYALLGGDQSSAPDLSQVDFSAADQFYDWMQTHQEVHDYEQAALGIS